MTSSSWQHPSTPVSTSGFAAATGTDLLGDLAPVSLLDNRGSEHGPLWLNYPNLPRDVFKSLLDGRVDAIFGTTRRSPQTLITHLGLLSLFNILPHHLSQLNTSRYWSADSFALLFTWVSTTCRRIPIDFQQYQSSSCGLRCPGAKTTYGQPYVWTWC